MPADPNQRTNIAEANPTLVAKLAALSDSLANCTGAQCRSLEDRGLD
jgi:hypothetical protein